MSAAGYGVAALVGLLAAGGLFVVSAAVFGWDALESRRFVLPMVAAGPLIACLLTFLSTRLLGFVARVAPSLIGGFAPRPVGDVRLVSAVALVAIGCVTAGLLLGLHGNFGGPDAPF